MLELVLIPSNIPNKHLHRHNPKSKLTEKILASPNVGVCKRCYDKIEWRKQYRKYKPLTQPSKCTSCQKKNVIAAYHTVCSRCAATTEAWDKMQSLKVSESGVASENSNQDDVVIGISMDASAKIEQPPGAKVCAMCCKEQALADENDSLEMDKKIEDAKEKMEEKLGRPLKLREQKAIERKIERAEEREKQRAKEERRRLREEAEHEEKEADANDPASEEDVSREGEDVDDDTSDGGLVKKIHSDNEEDEFLQKVGGKILTGEAYQQMLLQREKLEKLNL